MAISIISFLEGKESKNFPAQTMVFKNCRMIWGGLVHVQMEGYENSKMCLIAIQRLKSK